MSLVLQLWLPLLAISWSWVVTDGDDEADENNYIRVVQKMHNVWVQPLLHICTVPSLFANCHTQKYKYFEVFANNILKVLDYCRATAHLHIVMNLKRWQISYIFSFFGWGILALYSCCYIWLIVDEYSLILHSTFSTTGYKKARHILGWPLPSLVPRPTCCWKFFSSQMGTLSSHWQTNRPWPIRKERRPGEG